MNPECPVSTARYTWPNMAFYAYPPDLTPHMKGMMTLTYDLDLLHEHLRPKPKTRPQIWTLYRHSNRDKRNLEKPRISPKFGYSSKWRQKLLPVPVFTSDSCSMPSTWSKTPIISRGPPDIFYRYLGSKFTLCKWATWNRENKFLWRFVAIVAPTTVPNFVLYPLLFIMYTIPLCVLISSLSLDRHQYADDTQLFFSFHPLNLYFRISFLTFKTLFNRSLPGRLLIFLL